MKKMKNYLDKVRSQLDESTDHDEVMLILNLNCGKIF
jgi:hypothetical protein